MHRSRLGNIVIDCKTDELLAEARFWSAALGYPLPEDLDETGRFIKLITPPGDVQVINMTAIVATIVLARRSNRICPYHLKRTLAAQDKNLAAR